MAKFDDQEINNKHDFKGKYGSHYNYLSSNYEFRYNVVSGDYEYRPLIGPKKIGEWYRYEDRIKNDIMLKMSNIDLDIPNDKFNLYIESGLISKDYNPFKDYFGNLKQWDKKTDYIEQLSKTIETEDQKVFYETLKKFLVGSVDCLMEPDSVNDVCLIFKSKQGSGKSRWMRSLLPEEFRNKYIYEGSIDTKNNDNVLYLSQYWFIHLDELEALRGNEISAIKSFITRQRISLRKAYGRNKTMYERRASFIGSVNDDKFLTDTTGNRRWLIFEISRADYEHHVDIDGLWSQVHYLWNNNFRYWFNAEEIENVNKRNEKFRITNEEEECLVDMFEFNEYNKGSIHSDNGDWYSSVSVIHEISKLRPLSSNKMTSFKMGKALCKHCISKRMIKGVQRYWLKLKENPFDEPKEEQSENNNNQEPEDDLPF